jgi:hypothetical protein
MSSHNVRMNSGFVYKARCVLTAASPSLSITIYSPTASLTEQVLALQTLGLN